jgi:RNA-binding protein NOB1
MQTPQKSIAILDANAFISMSSITNLASTTRLVTTADVLGELKDLKTKEFVENLPFEIEVVDPDQKILELVKEFAKKTGDIASLSLVDMELIAVAYAMYKKEGLESALRRDPPPILEKDDLEDYLHDNNLSDFSSESDHEEEATQPLEKVEETINEVKENNDE